MEQVNVIFTGTMPLLMHSDNIDWADDMEEWGLKAANKALSKPGDDRTPAWRWIGSLYHDGSLVVMPAENIMRSLMDAGKKTPKRSRGSFKAETQTAIVLSASFFPLLVQGKHIPMDRIMACRELSSFREQKEAADAMGFELFAKRARVGQKKHIRVRPRFSNWGFEASMMVDTKIVTKDTLQAILDIAGPLGLGDWRPGGVTPGWFGTFKAQVQ